MSSLFLIAAQYQSAAAALADLDLDPQTVADTLESMQGDIEVKAQNIAYVARNLRAEAEACAAWAKQASDRAKALEARADGLLGNLSAVLTDLGIAKVSGPGVQISFRTSTAVEIEDEAQIPAEYLVTPPPKPSKTLLKAALTEGRNVPGARLEQRRNLQIK